MAQSYTSIPSNTKLSDSLVPLLGRDDAAASCFSGTAFPSSNLLVGMLCYRTDQQKMYQLADLTPTWRLIYDISSGAMVAASASAVAWSGVSGKPTTLAGYGITDAVNSGGDDLTGKLNFSASNATRASLGVPHGTAPSSPVNGDMWSTTSGFFVRVNGNTFTLSMLQAAESFTAKKTFMAGSTAAASLNVPPGAAPTTPVNGDLWATTTALNYRMAGVTRTVTFSDDLGTLATLSQVSTGQIANLSVSSAKLADLAVVTSKIADNAVTGAKIAMGSDAQGDILYFNGTNYARLPAGTAGQYLKTNGAGANPAWSAVAALTQLSAVTLSAFGADTQGITGIAAASNVVYFTLRGVTPNSDTAPEIRLGTSGGYATSGYGSAGAYIEQGTSGKTDTSSTGIKIFLPNSGATMSGVVTMVNVTGNVWSVSYVLSYGSRVLTGGGGVDLGGAINRVALYAAGGWASGTIGVSYL